MSNPPPAWVPRAQTAAAQNKKVLAMEGKTDVAVYREWLVKELGSTWANRVHAENAEDRSRLLSGLQWLKANDDPAKDVIFGLADRDEWEAPEIASMVGELPSLLVNPSRHSLESYFCDPDELETILLARDSASGTRTFAPHLAALRRQIEGARTDHVPHWALGCAIQRANERIRSDAHYPTFFRDTCPLPSDIVIREKLSEWAAILEPHGLFAAFDRLRSSSLARPHSEQFRECIEPKLFFARFVVEQPHGLNSIQQKTRNDWLTELARWSSAMPGDLRLTLAPVLT
jgi:hypothetical protein